MLDSLQAIFVVSYLTSASIVFGVWLANESFKGWLLWRTRISSQQPRAPISLAIVYAKVWGWFTPLLNLVFFVRWFRRGLKNQAFRAIVNSELLNIPSGVPSRIVFLIHGTWRLADYRAQWATVVECLLKEEPHALLIGLHWPAFNSIGSRLQTARVLVKIARRWSKTFKHQIPIVFVGHSHGASVAFEALRNPLCPPTCSAVCLGMPPITPEPAPDTKFKGRAWWHPELRQTAWWAKAMICVSILLPAIDPDNHLLRKMEENLAVVSLILFLFLVRLSGSRRRTYRQFGKYVRLRRHRHGHEMRYVRRLAGQDNAYLGFHLWFVPRNIARIRAMRRAQLIQVTKDETSVFLTARIQLHDFFSRRVLSFMRLKASAYARVEQLLHQTASEKTPSILPQIVKQAFAWDWHAHRQLFYTVLASSSKWYMFPRGAGGFALAAYLFIPIGLLYWAIFEKMPSSLSVFALGVMLGALLWGIDPWLGELCRAKARHNVFARREGQATDSVRAARQIIQPSLDSEIWGQHLLLQEVSGIKEVISMDDGLPDITLRRHRECLFDACIAHEIMIALRCAATK